MLDAPSGLHAKALSPTQISLSWTDKSADETGFEIERSKNASGPFTTIVTAGANERSYIDSGLLQVTTYYYRVRAYKTAGQTEYSGYSKIAHARTLSLKAPRHLTASVLSENQISLTWGDRSGTETGFEIARATDRSGPYQTVGTVGADATSYTDSNLQRNTTYFFEVRAFDGINYSAYSSVAKATILMITASAGAGGSISPAGVILVKENASQTITITPTPGFRIADVVVDGLSKGAVSTYQFRNITMSHTITASFLATTFTITASSGANGAITPSGAVIVNSGGTVAFTITPHAGYRVTDVLVDGLSIGAVATYTFVNVTADHSITASFGANAITITGSSSSGGTLTPSGIVQVNYGANQTFTMMPNAGFSIADVIVDGASVGAVSTYAFSNVTTNHTISANFADTTPPTGAISINNGSAYTNTQNVTLTLSASDSGTGVSQMQFSNDGLTWSVPESFASMKTWILGSGDGVKTVFVKYKDNAGNWSAANTSTITLDTTPPAVTITQPTAGFTSNKTPLLTYTVSGGTVVVKVDGTTVSTASGNTLDALAEGAHQIRVESTDAAGNMGFAAVNITVDTTPPTGTVSLNNGAAYTNNTAVTLALSCIDALSGCSSMQLSPDNQTWSTPEAYAATKVMQLTPGDGAKTVYVKYSDNAGNASPAYSASIMLDMTPPVTTPSPAGGIYNAPQNVTLSSNETATTFYTTDGTEPTTGSPVYQGQITIAANTTLRFFSTDQAGNSEVVSSMTYTIDSQPPALTVSTLPDGSFTNNATLNIAGTVTDNVGVQGVTVNGASITINADNTFSQVFTLVTGTNTITTVATDKAGNTTTDIRTIILDQTAPVILFTSPVDNSITNTADLTIAGTVDKTAMVTVTLNGGNPVPLTVTGNSFSLPIMLVYGQNTIVVNATDLATNSGTASRTVTFDNVGPALAVTNPAQDIATNQSSIMLQGTVNDLLTGATVTISFDGTTYTPVLSSGTFQQTLTFTSEKTYPVIVSATDGAGNQTLVQRNIIYDVTPPTLTINPVTSPTNTTIQIIGGSIESGATVSVSSSTVTVSPVSYPTSTTWQAVLSSMTEGSNAITVTGTDQAGNISLPVSASIVLDTMPPVTTASPGGGFYNSGLFVTLMASEAATIYYTIDGTTPTTGSPIYSGPINVGSTTTLSYFAVDLVGNIEQPVKSATYIIDTTPPVVVSSSIQNNSITVPVNTSISTVFSEPLSSSTVTTNSVSLVINDGSNQPVPGVATLSSDRKTIVFAPTSLLVKGTKYKFTITSAITDDAGNSFVGPYVLNFTASYGAMVISGQGTTNSPYTLSTGGYDSLSITNSTVITTGAIMASGSLGMTNSTLITQGKVSVNSITLTSNSVLTHAGATTTNTWIVDVTAATTITIDSTSKIDVTGKGYLGGFSGGNNTNTGRTLGNTTAGGSTTSSSGYGNGGSYGGLGAIYSGGSVNAVYGDFTNPNELGSGGGQYFSSYAGGNGGGLVKITAGTLQVDGSIAADGGGAGSGGSGGGGSGGGVNIHVSTLSGSGTISAKGGAGLGGSGGGGRIAMYYDTMTLSTTNIIAFGGKTGSGGTASYNGGTGTIYLKSSALSHGDLIIGNSGTNTNDSSTPIRAIGSGVISALTSTSLTDSSAGWTPGALIGLQLNPNTGQGATYTVIDNNATTLYIDPSGGDLTQVAAVGSMYTGVYSFNSMKMIGASKVRCDDQFVVDSGVTIDGSSTLVTSGITASTITLTNGVLLTHGNATITKVYSLNLNATTMLMIDSTSKIDVTGKGYLGGFSGGNNTNTGRTLGNTTAGGSTTSSSGYGNGGSYGGLGAIYSGGSVNAVYGDFTNPNELGSGGGQYFSSYAGGNGGGLVKITAGTLQVDGSIAADGGGAGSGGSGGGGSGGGVNIHVSTLSGSGTISAKGGIGSGGGGGGGRIAIYYLEAFTLPTVNVLANGGAGGSSTNGSSGSVYCQMTTYVALWHMDGNWTDATGNGNNGTVSTAVFSTDARKGTNAGSFDGLSAAVSGPANTLPSGSSARTITAWIKTTDANGDKTILDYGGASQGSPQNYLLALSNGKAVTGNGDGYGIISGTTVVTDGKWHFVAGVYEGSSTNIARIYVDGVQQNSGLITQSATSGNTFTIGQLLAGGSLFNGLIDELTVYNKALSAEDILITYNSTSPSVIITSPAAGRINNRPLLIYTTSNGSVTVKVDGSAVSTTSGVRLNTLPDGPHTIRVESVNSEGIMSFAQVSIIVDSTPPVFTVNPVTSPTTLVSQTITGTMESGATIAVSTNTGAIPAPVSYPTATAWSCIINDLAVGVNTIAVTATNAIGTSATTTTSITSTAPTAQSISNVGISSNTLDVSTAGASVSIFFTMTAPSTVVLKIIPEEQGPTGTPVYQASQNCSTTGAYLFTWNGKDNSGRTVPDDAYLYILEATADGARTGYYCPDASVAGGDDPINSSVSGGFDPSRNIPMTVNYSVPTAARCSIMVAVPRAHWDTIPAWVYYMAKDVPLPPGNNTFIWDGRGPDGMVVVNPSMIIPGTTVQYDVTVVCASAPLRENYIITTGDTPKLDQVKTDPSAIQLSYGQFTRITYHLTLDSNVTITLTSPTGAVTTLLSNQAQSAGDHEFDWNGINAADTSGKKCVLSAEGNYRVGVTAVNPVSGSSSTTYGGLQVGF